MYRRWVQYGVDFIYIGLVLMIAFIVKPFVKGTIYLIGERKDQCQDNGYHLFKYIRQNHRNENFYYIIDKNSEQLEKIKDLGNIIYYKSFKHYLYYVLARKLICAHVASCTPDHAIIWKLEEKKIIKKHRIFIQHGITKEVISSLMYETSSITTFICGAKPEYDFIKANFNYPENSVKYLGFCRFDALHQIETKKQILVMPTWRQWFGMNGIIKMSVNQFLKSNYFINYSNLINNTELIEFLEEFNYTLIFYLHHEMQCYRQYFSSKSKNIIVAIDQDYDVQQLLKESEILITDYSSIAFDFAYMRKPLIYYQFDCDEYYKNHYQKGYFDYEKHGFGPIVKTEKVLIRELKIMIRNNCYNYAKRIDNFFTLYDKNNCKRIYEEIIE